MSSIDLSGFHAWLERWAPLAEWGVAAGTFALAIATLYGTGGDNGVTTRPPEIGRDRA